MITFLIQVSLKSRGPAVLPFLASKLVELPSQMGFTVTVKIAIFWPMAVLGRLGMLIFRGNESTMAFESSHGTHIVTKLLFYLVVRVIVMLLSDTLTVVSHNGISSSLRSRARRVGPVLRVPSKGHE